MMIVFIVANSTSFAGASDLFVSSSGRVRRRQGRWRRPMDAATVSRSVDEGLAAAAAQRMLPRCGWDLGG